ncbi:MAG TPA: DUF2783 domain-containing protein [Alphaproteobacteria bacterium]|nr:DUF2783 domain-containing protein [Alphaproteobacteria bacterium]
MSQLRTENAFDNPDDFYQLLIETHRGLTDQQSAMLNAKLILLLCNHIGDLQVIREALDHAKQGV